MAITKISADVPEELQDLASRLSWEDAVHLLCLYDGWAMRNRTLEIRARAWEMAETMRTLVRALPYDWLPPPTKEHTPVTALAVYIRTGKMPPAPSEYISPLR